MERDIIEKKENSVDRLRSYAKVRSDFKKRIEADSKVEKLLTKEDAQKALMELYKEASALTLPFGKTVEEIMKKQGLTKRRGARKF